MSCPGKVQPRFVAAELTAARNRGRDSLAGGSGEQTQKENQMCPTLIAESAVERKANLIRFAEFQPGVITYRDSPP